MKELNALQRSVINTILFSLEGRFDLDEDGDYLLNYEDVMLSLTSSEYALFADMVKKGI